MKRNTLNVSGKVVTHTDISGLVRPLRLIMFSISSYV